MESELPLVHMEGTEFEHRLYSLANFDFYPFLLLSVLMFIMYFTPYLILIFCSYFLFTQSSDKEDSSDASSEGSLRSNNESTNNQMDDSVGVMKKER